MSPIKVYALGCLVLAFLVPWFLIIRRRVIDKIRMKRFYKRREPKFWIDLYVGTDEHTDDIYGEDLSTRKEIVNN